MKPPWESPKYDETLRTPREAQIMLSFFFLSLCLPLPNGTIYRRHEMYITKYHSILAREYFEMESHE